MPPPYALHALQMLFIFYPCRLPLCRSCRSSAAAAASGQLRHCGAQQDRDDFLELLNYQRSLHRYAIAACCPRWRPHSSGWLM